MAKTSLDLVMSSNLMNSAPTLEGRLVRLKQLDISVLEPYLDFLAEPEGQRLTATTQKFTRDKIIDWLTTRPSAPNRLDWSIHDLNTDEFLGEVVLNEFDQVKNSMNIRIALAHPSVYGRGFGSDAMRLAALGGLGLTILPTFIVGRDLQARGRGLQGRGQPVYPIVGIGARQFAVFDPATEAAHAHL